MFIIKRRLIFILLTTTIFIGNIYANTENNKLLDDLIMTIAEEIKIDSNITSDELFKQKLKYKKKGEALEKFSKMNINGKEKYIWILLYELKKEVECPSSQEIEVWTGDASISEYLIIGYMHAISSIGSSVLKFIWDEYNKSEGEYKERLALIISKLEDEKVVPELKKIFYKTKNGYIRAQTIRGLSRLGCKDNECIELYKKGLKDEFCVRTKPDFIDPELGEAGKYECLVRSSAFSALRKAGIKAIRGSGKMRNEYWIEE
jgi:hypothetical protein